MRLREKGARDIKEWTGQQPAGAETEKEERQMTDLAYDHLEEAINELNEEQRQCVILFYLKKNSYNQISEKTGFSLMQVKSYIQNGKRNLRIILDRKLKEKSSGRK